MAGLPQPPDPLGPGLDHVQQTWTRLGEVDPLWAILSDPRRENGRWNTRRFFHSGELDIDKALATVGVLGMPVTLGTALDFGCGVGRVTQAMGRRFAHAHGVDIADSMIRLARDHDGSSGRCTFHHNPRADLGLFGTSTFDFVYSMIVLQHVPPADALGYVRELVRVVKPGGVVFFQLPAELVPPPLAAGQSRATGPLPDDGFRAAVMVRSPVRPMRAGEQRRLSVRVANRSTTRWQAVGTPDGRFAVRLANRWLGTDGTIVRQDDGRGTLPVDLEPGQATTATVVATAPAEPGRYLLALDLVQEGVAWFADRGSVPTQTMVDVQAARAQRRGQASQDDEKPAFEMHGVPRADVARTVETAGGTVVAVLDDPAAGDAWISYLFVCSKPPLPEQE